MHLLRLVYKFFLYRLKSIRLHGVHSPFVFQLYEQVILHNGHYSSYTAVENLRKKLLQKNQPIVFTDFGAGSKSNKQKIRNISQVAQVSAKSPKYAQLLFRLVNYVQPEITFELGTSLGITTSYLALARKKSTVITFEGCPNIAEQATHNFDKLNLKNIKLLKGNLDQTLPAAVNKVPKIDFVYFDGNHRYEPTMRYFQTCLSKRTQNSIFIFDDIYWSPGMEKAWKEIIRHPEVTLSIDLFQLGLIFFRTQQPKQHFTLWF